MTLTGVFNVFVNQEKELRTRYNKDALILSVEYQG
jgi:hypothetical protein